MKQTIYHITIKGQTMKSIEYRGFYVHFETQHNGSVLATAIGDNETIKKVFYFYSQSEIVNCIKSVIREHLGIEA
jgi:hypothetical protein